ncbi:MAG: hypothetical protein FWH15_09535 [Betaproteobacteria bacterium]|nr:hypothetical protein [Betaproteobacteria bacterium]
MKRLIAFAAICLLALSGCATSMIGKDFDEQHLEKFEIGKTTFQEAKNALGIPEKSEFTSRGNWLHRWLMIRNTIVPAGAFTTGQMDRKEIILVFDGKTDLLLAAVKMDGVNVSTEARRRLTPEISSQPQIQTQSARQPNAPVKTGRHSYTVENLPEVRACNQYPVARLTAQGAGVESYNVECVNGDVLSVRCESTGACRVLR